MTDETSARQKQINELCAELDIRPLERLKQVAVCEILGVSEPTLNRMRSRGDIAYLRVGRTIELFGYQIAAYLISQIQETSPCRDRDTRKDSKSESIGSPNKPVPTTGAGRGSTKPLDKSVASRFARQTLGLPKKP